MDERQSFAYFLTSGEESERSIDMSSPGAIALNEAQWHEVSTWIAAHEGSFPESVRIFLRAHQKYLTAGEDLRRRFEETYRELRRALGITASSERRRSGDPLEAVPQGGGERNSENEEERLLAKRDRCLSLGLWHEGLVEQHTCTGERIEEKLEEMKRNQTEATEAGASTSSVEQEIFEKTMTEEIEQTPEEKAAALARAEAFVARMEEGEGADPALVSVNEALMPEGAVLSTEHVAYLAAEASEELSDARVVKTLKENRVRYDISISVSRLELEVEKQVVEKGNGERTVIAATTDGYGPARYQVTWSALATLAILVGQFAMPLNRLATLFSCVGKRFMAGGLSRLLHYVAERLVAVYIELGEQLADSEILGGDDTSCRVLEVKRYFEQQKRSKGGSDPPWAEYRTSKSAEESIQRCEAQKQQRIERRAAGDREAKHMPDEDPSLGMLIGQHYDFESLRQDGQGGKQSLNTTVVTGRSIADDPQSLIVFYRSHLGGCGDLLTAILQSRKPSVGDVIVQADLSTTNLIRDPELLKRFNFQLIGCSAHARRPFALYEHEDPINCSFMLHLFKGLAIHEDQLDEFGRNLQNVLAVRQVDSRRLWEKIRELAEKMKAKWSKATKLGAAARYILKHYDKLTAYLDDPRLEPTNNMRERMLRTEKLIENSSMFRQSLEGRFVLDIIRTVLQTAVASRVPMHKYLMSVLRSNPDEVASHPERFTPLAYATRTASE